MANPFDEITNFVTGDQQLPSQPFGNVEPEEFLSSQQAYDSVSRGMTPEQVDLVVKPRSEPFTNMMAMRASMAEAHGLDKPFSYDALAEGYMRWTKDFANDPGFANMREMILTYKNQKDSASLKTLLDHYVNNLEIPKAAELVKFMTGLDVDQDAWKQDRIAFHQTVVDAVSPDRPRLKKMDQLLDEQLAAEGMLGEMVGESLRGSSITDKIVDYGALFLVSDKGKDLADLLNSNMADAGTVAKSFVTQWNELDPQTKIATLPTLYKHFLEAFDGNKQKAAIAIGAMEQAGGGAELQSDAFWDNVFLGLDLFGFTKAIRSIFKASRNIPGIAAKVDNAPLAGQLNSASLGSVDAGAGTGIDRLAAAMNASPVKGTSVLDPRVYTPHIHGETLRSMQVSEEKLAAMLADDSPLRVEPMLQNEIKQVQDRYLNKWRIYEDDPAMGFNEVKLLGSGRRGFVIEASFGRTGTGQPFKTEKGATNRLRRLENEGVIPKGAAAVERVGEDGWRISAKNEVRYQFDDTGIYQGEAAAGPLKTFFASPSVWMAEMEFSEAVRKTGQFASEQVSQATRAEAGKAVIDFSLTSMINDAVKPLGNTKIPFSKARESLRRVDQVLLQGDGHLEVTVDGTVLRGKTYTPGELKHGIDTPHGRIALNDDEVSAYYGLRRVADWMYVLKNDEYRNTLIFRNAKQIDVEGVTAIGKPYSDAKSAKASTSTSNIQVMYDPSDGGKILPHASVDYEAMYNKGYRLARLDDPVQVMGQYVDRVWVEPKHITELPRQVLHYKPGYVPKINKDAFYFVKEATKGHLNGVADQIIGTKTLRMFSSKKSAEAWRKTMMQAREIAGGAINKTDDVAVAKDLQRLEDLGLTEKEIRELMEDAARGKADPNNLHLISDRELSADQLVKESHAQTGGLFTGPRATHDIRFGVDGEPAKRFSAFESFQRYTQHLSNYFPRNEWRIAAQQRWLNTAKKLNVVSSDVNDYRKAVQEVHARAGSKEASSLKAAANWINDQARIPTAEEQAFAQIVRGLAEKLDAGDVNTLMGKGRNAVSRTLLNFAQTDPYAIGRSSAFNLLLGWFNPAQLFVQAQGATIAMSLHPKMWHRGMRDSFALGAVMHASDPTYIANVAKALGYAPEDLMVIHKLWRASGLMESVLSTADHAAAAQGYGITMNMLRAAADKGQFFYRNGELFNRSYSFSTALHKYLERTGKSLSQLNTADDLRFILDDTFHVSLNLTRANRAAWQKGVLSLPTQFMQIQAKWIENMLPGATGHQWTNAQKLKMLGMQTAIYGAAGVPFGAAAVAYMQGLTGAPKAEEQNKDINRYINGGIWDAAMWTILGADNEFGSRGSIAEGLVESAVRAVRDQHDFSNLLGAGGQALGRVGSGVGHAFALLAPLSGNTDVSTFKAQHWAYVANEIGKSASSWNNMTKAYMMHKTSLIMDSRGRVLVDKRYTEGFTPGTLIAQALGFRASEAKAVQALKDFNKSVDAVKSDISQAIVQLHHNYLGGLVGEINDPASAETVKAVMAYYEASVGDPVVWRDIQKMVSERVLHGTDEKSTQVRKYYHNLTQRGMTTGIIPTLASGVHPYNNPALLPPETK